MFTFKFNSFRDRQLLDNVMRVLLRSQYVKCILIFNSFNSTLNSFWSIYLKVKVLKGYFKSVWTAEHLFWTHLIWAPKLDKPGEKTFVNIKIDISYKYFSFLTYQRNV